MSLTQIIRYPLKSGSPEFLDSSAVTSQGLRGDRVWMLVDENGKFVTQRESPGLARLRFTPVDLEQIEQPSIHVAWLSEDGQTPLWESTLTAKASQDHWITRPVNVWGFKGDALEIDLGCEDLIAEKLGLKSVRIMTSQKVLDRKNRDGDAITFVDNDAILLTTEESLEFFNREFREQNRKEVESVRFRPNLVVRSGGVAFCEDEWREIKIGEVRLKFIDRRMRCMMPSIDQASGKIDAPYLLDALKKHRRLGQSTRIDFGILMSVTQGGHLRVGDPLEIIQ